MTTPYAIPNCPPGLECLTFFDQFHVKQEIDLGKVINDMANEAIDGVAQIISTASTLTLTLTRTDTDTDTAKGNNNKYTVKNNKGQMVYKATAAAAWPSLNINIFDAYNRNVIHIHRELACSKYCFPLFLHRMYVSAPPGNHVGSIEEEWSLWTPKFSLKNADGLTVLRIKGPNRTFSCCGDDVEFRVIFF